MFFSSMEKRKIIDCFIFYNELELLEYRLNTLYNEVDYFVIIESRMTHMGYKKELNFDTIRFKKYLPKIVYLVIHKLPFSNKEIKNNGFQHK